MRVDPRQTLGTPTPRDPISGELKRDRETITQFARRHGWTVKEVKGPDDYVIEFWFDKEGLPPVHGSLWPTRSKQLCTADINHIPLSQRWTFPMRERLERYLVGVECVCTFDRNPLATYEQMTNPNCPIHGEEEAWTS